MTLSVTPRGEMFAITIADNGPGVAPEDLKRILEPFEHAGRAQDHAKGAGLGLTLVKAFAELHGGALEIESETRTRASGRLAFAFGINSPPPAFASQALLVGRCRYSPPPPARLRARGGGRRSPCARHDQALARSLNLRGSRD